ncbi:HAD family hydrolase [bacterium]|nr:HAD family hydrolase [bacterium]
MNTDPLLLQRLHSSRLIAFDNDGTLYPAGLDVARSVIEAHRDYVQQHGLQIPTPDISIIHQHMGAEPIDFYGSMLPGQPEDVRKDFERFCLEYEQVAVARMPHLYEYAEDLLTALHAAGRTIVLISNGTPTYVDAVWEHARYERWMAERYPYGPPEYDSKGSRLARAAAQFGVDPATAVMVGDRASDRDAARYCGAAFIGCAYGYGEAHEIEGADAVAHDLYELARLLLPA